MLGKLQRISERVNAALAAACGVLILGIAFLTFVDAFGRYAFAKPLPAALEITILMLAWAASLSFGYGLIRGMHPRVTLFTSRLPHRLQPGLTIYINLAGCLYFGLLTYGAWLHFWSSWAVKEIMFAALMALPLWLGKLALPIGTFLISAVYFIFLMRSISKKG